MPFDESFYPAPAPHKRRACLSCAQAFDSAWAGERICPRCKASATWREDLARGGANHARYQAKQRRKSVS
jgi:uncharacterized paraquat-inducible protein A